ncbi:MAG: ArsR family transcriptional regulator [Planctomycetota bacterium]
MVQTGAASASASGGANPGRQTGDELDGALALSDPARDFVLHWGEMGSRWGVNRTVAQIHALLLVWPEPLNADQIAVTLSVARSNVSTSMRELQTWGIVRSQPVLGRRKEHFVTLGDAWEMFRVILDERRRRELDPTLETIRQCVDDAKRLRGDDPSVGHLKKQLGQMQEVLVSVNAWCDQVRDLPLGAVSKLMRMGSKVRKLIGGGS